MAEIAYSMNKQRPGAILYEWEAVTQADTFQRLELDTAAVEISAHIEGTFGSATVVLKGANKDADGVVLQQMDGTEAEATAEALFSILDRPLYITPTHSGGLSESINVRLLVRV